MGSVTEGSYKAVVFASSSNQLFAQNRTTFDEFGRAYQLARYRSVYIGDGMDRRRVIVPDLSWYSWDKPDIIGAHVGLSLPKISYPNAILTYSNASEDVQLITVAVLNKGDQILLDSRSSNVKKDLFAIPDRIGLSSDETKLIRRHTYRRVITSELGEPHKFEPPGAFHYPDKIGVALLISSKVNRTSDDFDIRFLDTLLSSFFVSLAEPEFHEPFHFGFYLGFDRGDLYYDNDENIERLNAHVLSLIPAQYSFQIYWVCTGDTHHAPGRALSVLGNLAYYDG